ncbi:bifunctional DNA primase/polymerase [Thermodesulfobacteriota bacterium]
MEKKLLNAALKYRDMGNSVIPISPKSKKALVKWEEFQNRKADKKQIHEWWKKAPKANIGIVTGKISNLGVVDVDSRKGHDAFVQILPKGLKTPVARTPKGGRHFYFKSREGLSNAVRFITDCDFRTDGGYIVAPPSIGENGQQYYWLPQLALGAVGTAPLPDAIYNILISINAFNRGEREGGSSLRPHDVDKRRQVSSSVVINFDKGYRDNSIFHIANHLVKGGMPFEEIQQLLSLIAINLCNPPYPQKEISIKIQSALKRAQLQERNLTQEVREWVLSSNGVFLSSDVYNCLQVSSRELKKNVSKILSRLSDEGVIERYGNKNGCFRRIEGECETMDFLNAETEAITIGLPFGVSGMIEVMPGNIILIAGEPNCGKTAFLLNVIKNNMQRFEVHYFNSEMGASELRKRLSKFADIRLDEWKFKPWERADNFGDVIKSGKDKINIIDFLELHDNFYEVSGKLAEIHKKLKGAIAVVALQKNKNTDTGLGGYRSLEKPRLALAMSPGTLKIVKAKNWRTEKNPNGLQVDFKIVNGCKFIQQGNWYKQ